MSDERIRVTLSVSPLREYLVEFGAGGNATVWVLFDRKPVSKRGYYQADNGARRIDANGPTGLRAIHAAADVLNSRAAGIAP